MRKWIILSGILFFAACTRKKEKADLVIYNAIIYTVDSNFSIQQSLAVKDGRILEVGTDSSILSKYDALVKKDLQKKAVYPGFIDAHCHFYGYGEGLQKVDLVGTASFEEVIKRVMEFAEKNKTEWILGRGWDQNDWRIKEFPSNKKLDSLFPSIPVLLTRVDGHAALANSAALKLAGITKGANFTGGVIEERNRKLTGMLIDNAVDSVSKAIPKPSKEQIEKSLLDAQSKCFAVGLTTVDDAGLDKKIVDIIERLQASGKLKMRIYAMLTPNKENLDFYLSKGPLKKERLNISSFKFYADGALGSRGACLLQPYSDQPGHYGFLLSEISYFKESAEKMFDHGFQMNTHCIGDSANRVILDIYGSILKGKNDRRWRIEHAQVVEKDDLLKFSKFSIIPSVQPTHATSDMYWAEERLGKSRITSAYAYKELSDQNSKIALGTDFPVEDINPIYTFYAAVVRKDHKGFPFNGFQTENALTHKDALKGMTTWAAYSNFEEKEKGSIESGKYADFVIIDKDIMKVPQEEILSAKVISTFVNGEKVFGY